MVCGGLAEVFLEVLSRRRSSPSVAADRWGRRSPPRVRSPTSTSWSPRTARSSPEPSSFRPGRTSQQVDRRYSSDFLPKRDLYVAIVTRCWETDVTALASVLRQSPPSLRYLGLMGSHRKVERVKREVEKRSRARRRRAQRAHRSTPRWHQPTVRSRSRSSPRSSRPVSRRRRTGADLSALDSEVDLLFAFDRPDSLSADAIAAVNTVLGTDGVFVARLVARPQDHPSVGCDPGTFAVETRFLHGADPQFVQILAATECVAADSAAWIAGTTRRSPRTR